MPEDHENQLIVRRLVDEVLNKGNLDAADACMAENFVEHDPRPGQGPGLAGFKQRIKALRTAFPDLHYTIEDEFEAADKVVVRVRARGTHRRGLAGIPPTGKRFTMTGIFIVRIADGKIVERWANYDNLAMLQQLGVVRQWGKPTSTAGPAPSPR